MPEYLLASVAAGELTDSLANCWCPRALVILGRAGEPNSLRLAKYLLATSLREDAIRYELEVIDAGYHKSR